MTGMVGDSGLMKSLVGKSIALENIGCLMGILLEEPTPETFGASTQRLAKPPEASKPSTLPSGPLQVDGGSLVRT